jgi:alkyl hydroperoxide reductase subunit F
MADKNLYDLIIIGAGPAGMTAAIYAARQKINFLILGRTIGGQVSWSAEVENYPGIIKATGPELVKAFQEHLKSYGVGIKQEEVVSVSKKARGFVVKTKKNVYESKAVIVASGKSPKKLGIPGEAELQGKGVSYCATCDAPLYKDKTVAIIGGANSGLEAALFLSKYASKIYVLEVLPKLGGDAYLQEKVLKDKKIQVATGVKIKEILGKDFVTGLKYEMEGKEEELKVDGVLVLIGLVTKADFVNVEKNRWGEIMLFKNTKTLEYNMTSVPGIFAAGDATDVAAKQIIVAAGAGCKAALAAFAYLNQWDKKK